jgi:hypothetical protein
MDWYLPPIVIVCFITVSIFLYAQISPTRAIPVTLLFVFALILGFPGQAIAFEVLKRLWFWTLEQPRDTCFELSHKMMKLVLNRDDNVSFSTPFDSQRKHKDSLRISFTKGIFSERTFFPLRISNQMAYPSMTIPLTCVTKHAHWITAYVRLLQTSLPAHSTRRFGTARRL